MWTFPCNKSYTNRLFEIVNDATILFQEISEQDLQIAKHFGLNFIGLNNNVGIGKAFIKLTQNAETENVLILEHDWNLIEGYDNTFDRLKSGIELINNGFDCVRYRHRKYPGYPHFSFRYQGKELEYYDEEF